MPAFLLIIPSFATMQLSAQSGWRQVGKAGEWSNTVMLRNMNGVFYSLESDGTMYATRPDGSSYTYQRINNPGTYEGTTLFAVKDGSIYYVKDGTLYSTDSRGGSWREISKGWYNTKAMTFMGGYIWSLEQGGSLYRSDLNGSYELIGETDALPNVDFLVSMGGKLYALDDGTIYVFDQVSKSWRLFGEKDDYWEANYLLGTANYLWVLFDSGDLYRVNSNGDETRVGGDCAGITLLDIMGEAIYAVKDGTLYRTH